MRDFLRDLKLMISEQGTEYPAPWAQVPRKYQEDFKSWCGEVKQQTWDGMWEAGWSNYHLEYLAYLIDLKLMEEPSGKTTETQDTIRQIC